jgi:hypothetical protein
MSNDFIHPISGLRLLRTRHSETDYDAGSASFQRKQRANAQALLKGPIRIRPEPADRDLAAEEAANHERIAYHQRRYDEEARATHQKFCHNRDRAYMAFSAKTDKLHEKYKKRIITLMRVNESNQFIDLEELTAEHVAQMKKEARLCQIKLQMFSADREAAKIEAIRARRMELSWTCPNDGQAHPFLWQGCQYHRTYDGEVWFSENWLWAGQWTGYYITHAAEAEDAKEATHQLCRTLRNW